MSTATRVRAVVPAVIPAVALYQPRAALRVIEEHLRADHLTGRCRSCGQLAPCAQLNVGYAGLYGINVLPRRQPGALLVEVDAFNAFAAAASRDASDEKNRAGQDAAVASRYDLDDRILMRVPESAVGRGLPGGTSNDGGVGVR